MNGLEFAIQMEMDGEAFYRKQALECKDGKLNPVFIALAEDEKKHAQIIKDKQAGKDFLLNENDVISAKNIFDGTAGLDVEKSTTHQIDAYKIALEMEEKSIMIYKKILAESNDNKTIFKYLIKQEEHYKLIEEIIKMLNRPNEWVESAEFGAREKY